MASQRRMGSETAKNRTLLIEAAGRLLAEEGYSAITARKVAACAGLKVQLVYYYFKTMDDLILALVKDSTAERMTRFVRALASADPLRALWELNRDVSSAISSTELTALANHREAIREEVVAEAKRFRSLQIEAVDRLLQERGVNREQYPPAGVVAMISALTRTMSQDVALGITEGYEEAVGMVEAALLLPEMPSQ